MVQTSTEKRDNWQFLVDAEGRSWSWERSRPDGAVERSGRSFGSLQECAADASIRGYGQWKNDERRQITAGRDALLMAD